MKRDTRGAASLLKRLMCMLLVLGLWGCGAESAESDPFDEIVFDGELDEFGKPTLEETGFEDPSGKEDALRGRAGLAVSADSSDLAVWEVRNAWSDRNTAEARKAGIAWSADSGLSWEEKYERWIESMPKVNREGGYGETFILRTPWGFDLPAPALECAEVSIFLRVTFASWYNLPFFMEATDGRERLYFGHFGIRTAAGRWNNMPRFKAQYRDYSSQAADIIAGRAQWPSDSNLAGRKIPGSFDDSQPMLGEGKHAGAYFDKVFLNKRVGYYLLLHLTYMGSVNLADPVNTYHIAPEFTRAGDSLLHRWQRVGIGHVLVVTRSRRLGTFVEIDGRRVEQLEAEVASGSMPRRQPMWESPASSKRNFTSSNAGGPNTVDFNGGVKRWRTAVNIGGQWTNVVLEQFADAFISSTAKERLAQRPAQYERILTELTDAQKIGALTEIIDARRAHLRNFPASCAARRVREEAFDDLYELGAELGMSKASIDAQYRELEDYVFAELDYPNSKTCCWNSSTSAMYQLVMDFNQEWISDETTGQCREPMVFMNRDDDGDGFEIFRQYAESRGMEAQWVAWRADENCPQANVAQDTEANHRWTPFCTAFGDAIAPTPGPTPIEGGVSYSNNQVVDIPDNDPAGASSFIEVSETGTISSLSIDLEIRHTYRGDLLVELRHNGRTAVVFDGNAVSNRSDSDVIIDGQALSEFNGQSAAGTWELFVHDRAAVDVGQVRGWSLHVGLD